MLAKVVRCPWPWLAASLALFVVVIITVLIMGTRARGDLRLAAEQRIQSSGSIGRLDDLLANYGEVVEDAEALPIGEGDALARRELATLDLAVMRFTAFEPGVQAAHAEAVHRYVDWRESYALPSVQALGLWGFERTQALVRLRVSEPRYDGQLLSEYVAELRRAEDAYTQARLEDAMRRQADASRAAAFVGLGGFAVAFTLGMTAARLRFRALPWESAEDETGDVAATGPAAQPEEAVAPA